MKKAKDYSDPTLIKVIVVSLIMGFTIGAGGMLFALLAKGWIVKEAL